MELAAKKRIISYTRKIMSGSFVESASLWLALATVVLGALAGVAGAAAWVFAHWESNMKDEKLKRYQEESATKIAEAHEGQAKANQLAAEANERAAKADLARAKLEADIEYATLPRSFPMFSSEIFDSVSGFSNCTAVIRFSPDEDSTTIANNIRVHLNTAKWNVTLEQTPKGYFFEGVGISMGEKRLEGRSDEERQATIARGKEALIALAKVLEKNNLNPSSMAPGRSRYLEGTVIVDIGPKPNPFERKRREREREESWNRAKTNAVNPSAK